MAQAKKQTNPSNTPDFGKESFENLLNETLPENSSLAGQVVRGTIVSVDKEAVVVDVGLKAEGRIPRREFDMPNESAKLSVGDQIDVYVESLEDRHGEARLSREKARREESWGELEKLHNAGERVSGIIFNKVKGGFTVDLNGAMAFLPGSQVDIRPIRDISPLMGTPQPFMILKMDRQRGNIVVSRRAILEESRAEARTEVLSDITEGKVLTGIVKNVTDYGAFVDLGGVDGLLHVTDISWSRINHPSEMLEIGQSIEVQVIKFNEESQRISLGMKQLADDPWSNVVKSYTVGERVTGKVTNVTDYGAFVELELGIEGLVHVSEMSWTKKNVHPSKLVSTSEEVEVVVLEVDDAKRRISLGMKQIQENPWTAFDGQYKQGDEIDGTITNTTEFGLFVDIGKGIEGMVHISDLTWDSNGDEAIKSYKIGDSLKVKVLEIIPDKERVALGVKQLTEDPFESGATGLKKGSVVTCTVSEIDGAKGISVTVNDDLTGYIKKSDLSREKGEQRTDRFAVGEKLDAKILTISKKDRSLSLSIKARELDEDKEALAQYGSSDSGASLGDILGAAIQAKEDNKDEAQAKDKETKAKATPKKKKAAKKDEAATKKTEK